ncbi:MAG TPA: 1,4-dihydroxy-6-naphthoate synthase [Polyangia bacterium]|nr:1,4-dihydroxy-6-naphthoate synthase [Polyangia bacterium]
MSKALSIGFSPCPNDTFIFYALVHGLVNPQLVDTPELADVQTLNKRAQAGELDLIKVSYGAVPDLLDRYRILRSGGALGHGCGPLLVAREPGLSVPDLAGRGWILIPGQHTTAFLLLMLRAPELGPFFAIPFDKIPFQVEKGDDVAAGLIIHESRFTYQQHGLHVVCDLGEWWEQETGLPLPLGAILARRDLGFDQIAEAEAAVRASVEWALANPAHARAYVRQHAFELDDSVIDAHIKLYVNDYSVDVGEEGAKAVRTLFERGAAAGLLSTVSGDPFQ